MTAETAPAPSDPDLSMGLRLQARQRHERSLEFLRVGAVWLVLILALTLALTQLRIEPGYLIRRSEVVLKIVGGLWTTILVSLVSVSIAAGLALVGALGRLSANPIAQGISGFYVSVIRGTPLLIQIYIIYLGLPQIGLQLQAAGFRQLGQLFILDAITSGVLALSLNYGAYMTEIFRAGLQSIPHGQWEAAEAIGMTRWQILRRIILPQAIRIIIPDVGNQFIAMQKDSALVSVMGVWEITYLANRSARLDSKYMELFLVAAGLYWLLTIVSTFFQSRLEKRMATAYER
ncbi:MAG: amino acid ABC transporter permease [Anaerolineales bacterium]|nr:amino acid ABC transporter permease [Anaerolineales bacterium]